MWLERITIYILYINNSEVSGTFETSYIVVFLCKQVIMTVTLCRVLWRLVLRICLISSSRPLVSCGRALSAGRAEGGDWILGWMFLTGKNNQKCCFFDWCKNSWSSCLRLFVIFVTNWAEMISTEQGEICLMFTHIKDAKNYDWPFLQNY